MTGVSLRRWWVDGEVRRRSPTQGFRRRTYLRCRARESHGREHGVAETRAAPEGALRRAGRGVAVHAQRHGPGERVGLGERLLSDVGQRGAAEVLAVVDRPGALTVAAQAQHPPVL